MRSGKLLVSVLLLVPILAVTGPALYSSDGLAFDACWSCRQCTLGGSDHHVMEEIDPNKPAYYGGHTWCVYGECTTSHPGCGGELLASASEDAREDIAAVEQGDVKAAVRLHAKWPRNFVWNTERRSLQVTTPCLGGFYLANMPLTDDQVAAMEKRYRAD